MTIKNATPSSAPSLVQPARSSGKRRRERRHRRAPPFPGIYMHMLTDDGHPVDEMIRALPRVHRLDRRALQLADACRAQLSGEVEKLFVQYLDARFEQVVAREELYFDAGHQYGREAGRAEGLDGSIAASGQGESLARAVRQALHESKLPARKTAVLLLEMARGLLTGGNVRA